MKRLLEKDPLKRIKSREILDHLFVKGSDMIKVAPNRKDMPDFPVKRGLSGWSKVSNYFGAANAFTKVTSRLFVNLRVSAKTPET
jgi:serine/threonine protein kinase